MEAPKFVNQLMNKMTLSQVTKDRVSKMMLGGKFVICILMIVLKYFQPTFSDLYFTIIVLSLILIRTFENLKIETKIITITGADYLKELNKQKSSGESNDAEKTV